MELIYLYLWANQICSMLKQCQMDVSSIGKFTPELELCKYSEYLCGVLKI